MSAELHHPDHPVRVVTAASLFDGHDAAINIMRRILQSQGAEVVHLGHNRSVDEVVRAAVDEDAHAVAVSSYQGGHLEYFRYLVDRLRAEGRPDVKVFGGGGGVIVPEEIAELHDYGVAHIFSPEDGQRLGLARMVNTIVEACDVDLAESGPLESVDGVMEGDHRALARDITAIQGGMLARDRLVELRQAARRRPVPVLGVTGTGGSGKSSLTDEVVRRFRLDYEDKLRIAVVAIDPTRRRAGGALLGDRIRMNAVDHAHVFVRSLATRGAVAEVPEHIEDVIAACQAAGHDLVVIETPGIGQGDTGVVDLVDRALYVMTPEFGAASQLEKIDMLDFADAVAINKFERRGADDALRDVGRQLVRNRDAFGAAWHDMPVFGTSAATFDDDGVTALYHHLRDLLADDGLPVGEGRLARPAGKTSTRRDAVLPPNRVRYLAEITEAVRGYQGETQRWAELARRRQHLWTAREIVGEPVAAALEEAEGALPAPAAALLDTWPATVADYSGDELVVSVRDRELRTPLTRETLSGNRV